ncbi:hypothetical protein LTR85_006644 [Meristemomyces frigidus]|nr:hypothetical protein LTR85_006644 [Meristemomyces frigidus]
MDKVFNIPELLELILLSLPHDTTYEEVNSTRTILLNRTICRTWHSLITFSTPVRKRLYLATTLDTSESKVYQEKSAFPPARPNPWTPHILLNMRSWGTAYPFDNAYSAYNLDPSQPKFWTFNFELSKAQYERLPPAGHWREMLATSPPFTDFWYTRCFYELGSGRAPFVTHLDYDAKLAKTRQRYRVHSPQGVTLGMIVDAISELFDKHSNARFVMIESLRVGGEVKTRLEDDRPLVKEYLPGSSAERDWGWNQDQHHH